MELILNGGVCQLHKAASQDQERYSMNSVMLQQVETDNGPKMRCVATDGYQLAVVDLPYAFGEDMPGRISLEAWSTAAKLKANKKGCNGPVLKANRSVRIIGKYGEEINFERPSSDSSTFPRYEAVIPIVKPGATVVGINPYLLVTASEAIGVNKDNATVFLTINSTDEETPRLVSMARRTAHDLEEALNWTPPTPTLLTRREDLTDEQWTDELARHQLEYDLFVKTETEANRESVRALAYRLVRNVASLRSHPSAPPVMSPILVTRPHVGEAKAVVMPITVSPK